MPFDATPLATDWNDVNAMIADIQQHRADTGESLVNADDDGTSYVAVRIPRLGFKAEPSGKTWTITIRVLHDQPSIPELPGVNFRNAPGRKKFSEYVLSL